MFIQYVRKISGQRELETRDVLGQVRGGASKGLTYLLSVLTEGTEENLKASHSLKVKVAQDLLNREGSAPRVSRSQNVRREVGLHLNGRDIEELKRRAVVRGLKLQTK